MPLSPIFHARLPPAATASDEASISGAKLIDAFLPASAAGIFELLSPVAPGWGGTLLVGLLHSIEIAIGATCLGLLIGTGGAFGKLYGGPVTRDLLAVYTTVVRAVPELVLILLLYYAGTDLINQLLTAMGYQRIDISGLAAGIFVLGVVQGAYSTEVIRGAILSIPQGQIEAARAYGMPPLLMLRRITVPAMLPFAIPGLANLWLIATKDTALLAVVGFFELTLATRQAAGVTKAYLLFFVAAGALYLALTLFSNLIIGRVEAWSRRGMPSVKEAR
ncbi:histidine/lysine/arginine/ornithine transporter subunit; membrane component of ABC superfamily [Mesorhizobium sp. ORS 3324]|nr:histidine/lysine/arginine/ornithine transporter subunit; membrane component of ABC superfamily [Mesorhizobium sp. ORS 3324]